MDREKAASLFSKRESLKQTVPSKSGVSNKWWTDECLDLSVIGKLPSQPLDVVTAKRLFVSLVEHQHDGWAQSHAGPALIYIAMSCALKPKDPKTRLYVAPSETEVGTGQEFPLSPETFKSSNSETPDTPALAFMKKKVEKQDQSRLTELVKSLDDKTEQEQQAFLGFYCMSLCRLITKGTSNVLDRMPGNVTRNLTTLYGLSVSNLSGLWDRDFLIKLQEGLNPTHQYVKMFIHTCAYNAAYYKARIATELNCKAVFDASIMNALNLNGMPLLQFADALMSKAKIKPNKIWDLFGGLGGADISFANLIVAYTMYAEQDAQSRAESLAILGGGATDQYDSKYWRVCRLLSVGEGYMFAMSSQGNETACYLIGQTHDCLCEAGEDSIISGYNSAALRTDFEKSALARLAQIAASELKPSSFEELAKGAMAGSALKAIVKDKPTTPKVVVKPAADPLDDY